MGTIAAMTIWIVPWPYDEHGQGEILVEAATPEDAHKAAVAAAEAEEEFLSPRVRGRIGELAAVRPAEFPYINHGCDC